MRTGVSAGFEIALETSERQKEGETPGKRRCYFLCQTLVCTKPWFERDLSKALEASSLVAHDCGYPLSRYTCRATRVAADFLDFIAFCRCSTGVALHPLKILVSHLPHSPSATMVSIPSEHCKNLPKGHSRTKKYYA